MNKVYLVGRLTREPELRTTSTGVSVASFTVAVTRRMSREREEADFINVVAWRGLGETCAKYLVKGQQVCVVGELRTRSYDARDGSKRYVTEVMADDVEFLAKPGSGGAPTYAGRSGGEAPSSHGNAPDEDDLFEDEELNGVILEDENLPF